MAYHLGQKLIHIGKMAGKPAIAFVVGDPDGYIVFLSDKLVGGDRFPVHQAKMEKEWKEASKQKKRSKGSPEKLTGKQSGLFPEKKKIIEVWRANNLKNG